MVLERMHARGAGRAGFSLIEIMVVIVIIGLLASAATLAVRGYLNAGRRHTAKMAIGNIVKALDTYEAFYGRYPSEQEGLAVLYEPSNDFPNGILQGSIIDPWGNPYDYIVPGPDGQPFEVISYGADGREGGTGAATDISSAELDFHPDGQQGGHQSAGFR